MTLRTSIASLRTIGILLLVATASVSACSRKEKPLPDLYATVGQRHVMAEDFRRYIDRNAGNDLQQLAPEASTALLDQFLNEILLSEYAVSEGIDFPADRVTAAVRNDPGSTLIEKRDELRRATLIARVTSEIPQPTAAEISDYYRAHADEFKVGERIRVRQILVHDSETAQKIVDDLRGGAKFEELSAQYSAAPNAKEGGDIGYVGRGQLPKIFEDEIFALAPGTVSKVIETDNSFHIFRVEDHQNAGMIDLASAEPTIRDRLTEGETRRRIADLDAKARAAFPVKVYVKHLPFAYSGAFPRTTDE